MRFTVFSAAVLAFAQHACTLPVEAEQASGLDVTLSQVSDTRIKAVVKNTGNEDVTFVHLNFFRDSAPVKKVAVYKDGIVDFHANILFLQGLMLFQTMRSLLKASKDASRCRA